jgi:hypothetical protein
MDKFPACQDYGATVWNITPAGAAQRRIADVRRKAASHLISLESFRWVDGVYTPSLDVILAIFGAHGLFCSYSSNHFGESGAAQQAEQRSAVAFGTSRMPEN